MGLELEQASLPSNRSCDATSGSVKKTIIAWTYCGRLTMRESYTSHCVSGYTLTSPLNDTFPFFTPNTDTQWTLQVLFHTIEMLINLCSDTSSFW